MSDMQAKLDYADAIADWFLEIGQAHCLHGHLEEGLKCTHIAATILSRQNRNLSSACLESNIRFVASCLADRYNARRPGHIKTGQKEVCLHVLNEALPAGGLTAMAIRWMSADRNRRIHSVALLSQEIPIPDALLQAVGDTGGSIYTANQADEFLHRAVWLKNLANGLASYVILHIGVSDVICGVAFGTKDGPPVLLVNHTAHAFWTGASIADLVVNCRGSALEALWTSTHRGIPRHATVPIPLTEPSDLASVRALAPGIKRDAKEMMGLPPDAVAIITVGAGFKYLSVGELDFVEVLESVLSQLPEVFLLAVGFDADERWSNASRRVGSRIRVLGALSQLQLAKVHEAADVYVEGFPFGTTTALLEAGLKGIPVVLAPVQCPPPYGTDGVAVDDVVERPRTLDEYKIKIIQLCKDPVERASQGKKIKDSVVRHHTGSGWGQYLENALKALPREHCVYPSMPSVRTPEAIHEYWAELMSKWSAGYEETLEHAVTRALSVGLRPRLTQAAREACVKYRSVRHHRTIPLPLLVFLCNVLFPALPTPWVNKIFRLLSFLYRGSVFSRARRRIVRLFGGTDGTSGYEAYRQIRGCPELFRSAKDSVAVLEEQAETERSQAASKGLRY